MSFRSILSAAGACVICFGSTVALADGTISADSPKLKVAAEKFTGLSYDVKSPRDLATGQASGRRQHTPICVFKPSSVSSPQWFTAVTTNERFTTVTMEINTLKIVLTNATASEFHFLGAEGKDVEEVCFTFDKITISHPRGTTGTDNWRQ
jgi:type VI secretion system secreted protein Hcp